MTEEELADRINNVIAAKAGCKRIVTWGIRQLKDLNKLEDWLKDEQGKINKSAKKT